MSKNESLSCEMLMKEIFKTQPLTAEEEKATFILAHQGDRAARDKLVRSNLKFVVKVANKYKQNGIPLEDLIDEGSIGLMTAIDKFDPSKGYKFITYAVWWIRQSMQRYIAEMGHSVKLPVNNKACLLDNKFNFASLDTNINNEEGDEISLGDLLEDTHYMSPDDNCVNDDLKEAIRESMGVLSEKEQTVVTMRFGLDGSETRSLQEVGKKLGCTKECIRMIEKRSLRKIREELFVEEWLGDDYRLVA